MVRPTNESELDQLARVWYHAWRDAHLDLMPEKLTLARTLESFRARLSAMCPQLRVVGPPGNPLGFYHLRESELHQLFVAAEARGTGVAAELIADAERQLAASGVTTAWLSCAIGNHRAARFYEKSGWRLIDIMMSELSTPDGPVMLETWRFEKDIGG